MPDHTSKPKTLKDEDIVTQKRVSRRTLLTSMGLAAGAAAMAAGTKKVLAKDQKEGDFQDRTPPKIDGSTDID